MRSHFPKRQRGMTFIGWLLVLAIAGFFAAISLTLIPIYLEHYSIKHVLAQFENDRDLAKKSNGEIRTLMKRRLKINGVYDFDVNKNLIIKRNAGKATVQVKYEVREPFVGNVDVVVHFDESITR
jgi:hypothetical protein